MSQQAKATFKNESWNEDTYAELPEGGKLSRAEVKQSISGDMAGETSVQWLMAYKPDETADFVGVQVVEGSIGDREGTFVMKSKGTFDGKEAKGDFEIVEGSGTGALAGITGTGSFGAPHGPDAEVELDYELG